MAKTVKVGPEMPEGLSTVNADMQAASIQVSEQKDEASAVPVLETVKTTDSHGNVVETIVSVMRPRVESRPQVSARVRNTYTDNFGNVVEEY